MRAVPFESEANRDGLVGYPSRPFKDGPVGYSRMAIQGWPCRLFEDGSVGGIFVVEVLGRARAAFDLRLQSMWSAIHGLSDVGLYLAGCTEPATTAHGLGNRPVARAGAAGAAREPGRPWTLPLASRLPVAPRVMS